LPRPFSGLVAQCLALRSVRLRSYAVIQFRVGAKGLFAVLLQRLGLVQSQPKLAGLD
jgi:hypothetical protein